MLQELESTSQAAPVSMGGRAPGTSGPRGGFTLIEALVAIGAMTLVAVGIAQIFQSVGKTISAGRRLNVVNTQAAMIELQLRRDFASMTRDGFLLIRNSYADANATGTGAGVLKRPTDPLKPQPGIDDTVRVSQLDTHARLRRVDEVMFFASGDFASGREPLDPRYVARSKEARIYYGHGLRMTGAQPAAGGGSTAPFLTPDVGDGINVPTNRLGRLGPNQYAKDWTLLRQPTLLVKPDTVKQTLPPGLVFGWNPGNAAQARFLYDHAGQVALQPAATSVFRSLNRFRPDDTVNSYARNTLQADRSLRAVFESGLVDLATEDLGAIRSIVLSPSQSPAQVPPTSSGASFNNVFPPDGVMDMLAYATPTPPPRVMHQWMDDAWPAPSDPSQQARDSSGALVQGGLRVRYEPGPVNYVGALTATGITGNQAAGLAALRSDQLTLSASNFLAGCTEFIVEYSFGVVDPATNQLVWHGLQREADLGDGTPVVVTRPYPEAAGAVPGLDRSFTLTYTNIHGREVSDISFVNKTDNQVIQRTPVPRELIYSNTLNTPPGPNDLSQTAHFGYLDPVSYVDPAQVKGPDPLNPLPPDGRPWAWPTLVRITLSLTDPNNPSAAEETFQFVLPTPGNPL